MLALTSAYLGEPVDVRVVLGTGKGAPGFGEGILNINLAVVTTTVNWHHCAGHNKSVCSFINTFNIFYIETA